MVGLSQRKFLIITGSLVLIITVISFSVIHFSPTKEKLIPTTSQKPAIIEPMGQQQLEQPMGHRVKTGHEEEEEEEEQVETPLVTPFENPLETPLVTPLENPLENPLVTPLVTPLATPLENPLETPLETPLENPLVTPLATPLATPLENPLGSRVDEEAEPVRHSSSFKFVQGKLLPLQNGRCFGCINIDYDSENVMKIFMSLIEENSTKFTEINDIILLQREGDNFMEIIKEKMGKLFHFDIDGITFEYTKFLPILFFITKKPTLQELKTKGFVKFFKDLRKENYLSMNSKDFFVILKGTKTVLDNFDLEKDQMDSSAGNVI